MGIQELFELDKIEQNTYRHTKSEKQSATQPNGLIISRAVAAAIKSVPKKMKFNSCHTYFHKKASAQSPCVYHLDRIDKGDDVWRCEVDVKQADRILMRMQMSFFQESRESIAHQCHMPVTPMPDFCMSVPDAINQLLDNERNESNFVTNNIQQFADHILKNPINELYDIRIVDAEPFSAATMKGFFTKIWAKAKKKFDGSQIHHKLLASYFVETTLLPSMLRYHISYTDDGQEMGFPLCYDYLSRGFSPTELIPLDFCVWVHSNEVNVNEWLLCENHFSIAKCGRGFIEHHLWTANGTLIMTASSEALVKGTFTERKASIA